VRKKLDYFTYTIMQGIVVPFLFKNKDKTLEILNITRILKDVGNDRNGEYKASFGGFCLKNGIIH